MQKTSLITKFLNAFMMIWAISSIAIFIYFPGRISYLQRIKTLDDIYLFFDKLREINLGKYLFDLTYSAVGVLLFSLVCILLGIFVAKRWKFDNAIAPLLSLDRVALAATEFLLGQSILSLVFLALAAWNQLTAYSIISVLILCIALGLWEISKSSWGLQNIQMNMSGNNLITWLSIIVLAITLLQSSARISYDSSTIYFSDAKLTAMNQGIRFFSGDTFEVSVFHTAIQYSVLIRFFGDQSARMFSWVCGIVFVFLSFALANKVGLTKSAGAIFLALLSTTTAFTDLMGDGKVDLISSLPAIACVYWMVIENRQKEQSKSLLLLIGFLAGFACVARPFNAFLLGIFIVFYYGNQFIFRKEFAFSNYKLLIQTLSWIGIGAIGLGIYHIAANWIILKNPIAFMSSVSGINPQSGPWDFEPNQMLILRLFYLIVITFRNSPQSLGNISPLFIAFVPILIIPHIRKRVHLSGEIIRLTVAALITLLIWIFSFFTITEIRYVIFLWAILFIPSAEIINTLLNSEDTLFQAAGKILITTLLIFVAVRSIYISFITYSPIDQNGNPQCFDSVFCEYLKPVNRIAAVGDRTLNLGAYRYYLRSDLFACSTIHNEYKTLKKLSYGNNEIFWEEVYRQGYKYITYENDYTTRHLQFGIIPSPDNAPNWIKLEPVFGKLGDLYIAYKINVINPPVHVEKICQKNSSGIWEVRSIAP